MCLPSWQWYEDEDALQLYVNKHTSNNQGVRHNTVTKMCKL